MKFIIRRYIYIYVLRNYSASYWDTFYLQMPVLCENQNHSKSVKVCQ